MAASLNTGWTVASLLPSLASGFSPGSSVGSRIAPAQTTGNPTALKPALSQSPTGSNFRASLLSRILGPQDQGIPKQPGINPAVNSLSSMSLMYPSMLSRL